MNGAFQTIIYNSLEEFMYLWKAENQCPMMTASSCVVLDILSLQKMAIWCSAFWVQKINVESYLGRSSFLYSHIVHNIKPSLTMPVERYQFPLIQYFV